MARKKQPPPPPPSNDNDDEPTALELWAQSDPTTRWAEDVVSGKIMAGDLVRRAAARHISDMKKPHLRWRPDKAAEALLFFPSVFTVTGGAAAGQPFNLPSYLAFVVGSIFGWYRESGALRFREVWLELPKGQCKTPLAAAIGLYIMGWRNIPRAEIYAIAKDKMQAGVLFSDAVALCRAPIPGLPDSLESREDVVIRGTGAMAWQIEHQKSQSKFRALAHDENISGPKPSVVLADEVHEWKSAGQIELWKAALVKMPGDAMIIMITNTPAVDQLVATEMSEYYQGILRGAFEDDNVLAVIARVDTADKPLEDESCWLKALPLLDVTYPRENVRNAVASSKHRMATSLATQRLYFGVPVGSSEYWVDLDSWEAVQGQVDPMRFKGDPCYLSLDLSQKNDLTALCATWVREGKKYSRIWYWRPDYNVSDASKADGATYYEWAQDGYLKLVPGRSIEYEWVASVVQKLTVEHNVLALAFDPAHITEFRKACDRLGFDTWIYKADEKPEPGLRMVVHSQGRVGMHSKQALWMPRSLQQLEDVILREEIIIDRNPVTTWCSGNAIVEADAQNNRWLTKRRSRGRIDGVVALAMGIGLTLSGLEVVREPEYQMFVLK